MTDQSIYRPSPRRPGNFSLTPISTSTPPPESQTQPPSATSDSLQHTPSTQSSSLSATSAASGDDVPHKSRSVLNLTSSTLFGIYSPTAYEPSHAGSSRNGGDNTDVMNTPWGTGSQTPVRITSQDDGRRAQFSAEYLRERTEELSALDTKSAHLTADPDAPERRRRLSRARSHSGAHAQARTRSMLRMAARSAALFLIGVAYGFIVTQLHGSRVLAPVEVRNVDRVGWAYLCFWGISGVVLGNMLPWVDKAWGTRAGNTRGGGATTAERAAERAALKDDVGTQRSLGSLDWNPIVRSIGAFVGIAFAIRRLPWQSTLQLSLTLALANPMIWYLLDRSRAGFVLSTAFALTGASALLSINPDMLPTPIMTTPGSLRAASGLVGMSTTAGSAGANGNLTGTEGVVGVGAESGAGGAEQYSYEGIAVATWIASVLFCSCVCFGNIGRRLLADDGAGESTDRNPDAGDVGRCVERAVAERRGSKT